MQASTAQNAPTHATAQHFSTFPENSVLNVLSEGVMLVRKAGSGMEIAYANPALAEMMDTTPESLIGEALTSLFPTRRFEAVYEGLSQMLKDGKRRSIDFATHAGVVRKHFQLTFAQNTGSEVSPEVIMTLADVTNMVTRSSFLENRAVKLIDHAAMLESSRAEMETEIRQLRSIVSDLERAKKFDSVTGLPNRAHFLERGGAEFQRSSRYNHELSVVVLDVQGFLQVIETHGPSAGDRIFTGLAQVCETACRGGVDIAGRLSKTEVGVMLPETGLSGALKFVDRVKQKIADTPLQLDEGVVRMGVRTGIDAVQTEDRSFGETLDRALTGLGSS